MAQRWGVQPPKLTITVLDTYYRDVSDADLVRFGDSLYNIDFGSRVIGLFSVSVYAVHCTLFGRGVIMYSGGKLYRLIGDNFYNMIHDSLEDLGWFNPARKHLPCIIPEPVEDNGGYPTQYYCDLR